MFWTWRCGCAIHHPTTLIVAGNTVLVASGKNCGLMECLLHYSDKETILITLLSKRISKAWRRNGSGGKTGYPVVRRLLPSSSISMRFTIYVDAIHIWAASALSLSKQEWHNDIRDHYKTVTSLSRITQIIIPLPRKSIKPWRLYFLGHRPKWRLIMGLLAFEAEHLETLEWLPSIKSNEDKNPLH